MKEGHNLGNPGEMSVLELARLIVCLTKSKSKIQFQPLPQDDPRVRQPNIRRAIQHLSWQPKVDIEDGLTKTIRYFKTMEKKK